MLKTISHVNVEFLIFAVAFLISVLLKACSGLWNTSHMAADYKKKSLKLDMAYKHMASVLPSSAPNVSNAPTSLEIAQAERIKDLEYTIYLNSFSKNP